jgi:hypothetical protein
MPLYSGQMEQADGNDSGQASRSRKRGRPTRRPPTALGALLWERRHELGRSDRRALAKEIGVSENGLYFAEFGPFQWEAMGAYIGFLAAHSDAAWLRAVRSAILDQMEREVGSIPDTPEGIMTMLQMLRARDYVYAARTKPRSARPERGSDA